MFQFIDVVPRTKQGEPLRHKDGSLRLLRTGKAARKFASVVGKGLGKKIQPRPFAAEDWRTRENQRLTDQIYQPLPWINEEWWRAAITHAPCGDHFAHVSGKYQGRVAFTESEGKGISDIQTPMKAGKYLKRFCSLSDEDVRVWSVRFSQRFESGILQFAETKEDIVDVYLQGPSSCMYHPAHQYGSKPHHPTEAYSSGDCAVAYLMREGQITARTVVCPRLKRFVNVYGDYDRMQPLLDAAGYKRGTLIGMRLLKIRHKGGYVMPYLDCGYPVRDRGDHFVIEQRVYDPHNPGQYIPHDAVFYDTGYTSGMTGDWTDDRRFCESCGDSIALDGSDYCEDCQGGEEDSAACRHDEPVAEPYPTEWDVCGCGDRNCEANVAEARRRGER
jgi:hypothetical protein